MKSFGAGISEICIYFLKIFFRNTFPTKLIGLVLFLPSPVLCRVDVIVVEVLFQSVLVQHESQIAFLNFYHHVENSG